VNVNFEENPSNGNIDTIDKVHCSSSKMSLNINRLEQNLHRL